MNDKPWIKNYDKGVPTTIEYPKGPVFQFLEQIAQKYPDRACTIFKGAVISYKEMNAITDRIAGALAAMGVKKGDRVGIFMPNTPQFVMAYFGILKAGGVVVATNPLYTPPEIEYQVNDSGVEIMFVMTNFYKTIKAAQPKTKIKKLIVTNLKETLPPFCVSCSHWQRKRRSGSASRADWRRAISGSRTCWRNTPTTPRPKLDIGSDDTAMFQYSGGTTGVSKAAVATHFNVLADTLQIKNWMTRPGGR